MEIQDVLLMSKKNIRSFWVEIYYQKGEMLRSHTKENGNSIKRIQKKKRRYETK